MKFLIVGLACLALGRPSAAAEPDPVIARSLTNIPKPAAFSLPQYPDVEFKLRSIVKAVGGMPIPTCRPSGSAIFIKDARPAMSPPGMCYDASTKVDDSAPSVVVVDLETVNNSAKSVSGRYVLGFYETQDGKKRMAQEFPPWGSYGAAPYSSRMIRLGFVIPAKTDKVELVYGDFSGFKFGADFPGLEDKSPGRFKLDFKGKTIEEKKEAAAARTEGCFVFYTLMGQEFRWKTTSSDKSACLKGATDDVFHKCVGARGGVIIGDSTDADLEVQGKLNILAPGHDLQTEDFSVNCKNSPYKKGCPPDPCPPGRVKNTRCECVAP